MRRLERLKPRIAAIVDRQLDALEAAGPVVDLVEHFAAPIPFLVICDLLGLPDEDRAELPGARHARFDVTKGGIGTLGAVSESRTFLLEAVRRQRKNPRDGLIGKIIQDHGDEIDDLDLGGLADGVFTGGFETSASHARARRTGAAAEPEHIALAPRRRRGHRTRSSRSCCATCPSCRSRSRASPSPTWSCSANRSSSGRRAGVARSAGRTATPQLSRGERRRQLARGVRPAPTGRAALRLRARLPPLHRCGAGADGAAGGLPALVRRFPELSLAVDPAELTFRKLSIVYGVESLPVRVRAEANAGT